MRAYAGDWWNHTDSRASSNNLCSRFTCRSNRKSVLSGWTFFLYFLHLECREEVCNYTLVQIALERRPPLANFIDRSLRREKLYTLLARSEAHWRRYLNRNEKSYPKSKAKWEGTTRTSRRISAKWVRASVLVVRNNERYFRRVSSRDPAICFHHDYDDIMTFRRDRGVT